MTPSRSTATALILAETIGFATINAIAVLVRVGVPANMLIGPPPTLLCMGLFYRFCVLALRKGFKLTPRSRRLPCPMPAARGFPAPDAPR
jgi:hypothetical protein